MKRCFKALLMGTMILLGCTVAALGSETLVPLSYLTTTFQESFLNSFSQKAEDSLPDGAADAEIAGVPLFHEFSLKEQDTVVASTGSSLLPLSGGLQVSYRTGAVIDATDGTQVPSGGFLSPSHRYIVAEDTEATFTVLSQVSVLSVEGRYTVTPSRNTIDYVAMADALKSLGLFQGSDTGYGSGYDLDRYPTRLEALVMFIRVLGEEEEALACTLEHPFVDVPWGDAYVAYAYDKGYTNGISPDVFGSNYEVSAASYIEFLMRALGVSKAGVDDFNTALTRAKDCGLLTEPEQSYMETEGFYRAQVAYLSFVALDRSVAGTMETLGQSLVEKGLFSLSDLNRALGSVSSVRFQ